MRLCRNVLQCVAMRLRVRSGCQCEQGSTQILPVNLRRVKQDSDSYAKNHRSLLQNIISFIGLFCKRILLRPLNLMHSNNLT